MCRLSATSTGYQGPYIEWGLQVVYKVVPLSFFLSSVDSPERQLRHALYYSLVFHYHFTYLPYQSSGL